MATWCKLYYHHNAQPRCCRSLRNGNGTIRQHLSRLLISQPEISLKYSGQKILYLSFMEQKRKSASKIKAVRGRVYFIGSGPGDPELITLKAKKIIAQADLIIYAGSLVNPLVFSEAKKIARILDSASMTLEEVVAEMIHAAQDGKTVARLHSGDPSVYGAISEQMNILDRKPIAYEVIPSVTSAFAPVSNWYYNIFYFY